MPRGLELLIAQTILQGFDAQYGRFLEVTSGAQQRFEQADWHAVQQAMKNRIHLYDHHVGLVVEQLRCITNGQSTDAAFLPRVLHCFTEDRETAGKLLDLGFYISFSGIVTFRNAEQLRDAARYVPLDRLLVETDSPYLAPVPHRGKENQPAMVRDVAEYMAVLKGVAVEELAQVTTDNFARLFHIDASRLQSIR